MDYSEPESTSSETPIITTEPLTYSDAKPISTADLPQSESSQPNPPPPPITNTTNIDDPIGDNAVDKTPDSAYGTKSSGSHSNIQFSFTNDDAMSTTNSTNTSSLMNSPRSPRYIQRNPVTGAGYDDARPRSRQSCRKGNDKEFVFGIAVRFISLCYSLFLCLFVFIILCR